MRKRWVWALVAACGLTMAAQAADDLQQQFVNPPDAARPWVYWYFNDGNLNRAGMSADLAAMKRAGIGGGIFLEVNIGVPQGPVKFMSAPWQDLVRQALSEADKLGLGIAMGSGPGWCGTGGPWVKPEESMQHLVASDTSATGPSHFAAVLPRPQPRTPFFGVHTLTPELRKQWQEFYQDVAVLAFPTPQGAYRIADSDAKALYYRGSYSSQFTNTGPGCKPFIPAPADFPAVPPDQCIAADRIIDLTMNLDAAGRLVWDVPPGQWTIMRFGRTITGQTTRPAPQPGLGFETDKFDKAALDAHFAAFVAKLLQGMDTSVPHPAGLTTLHFDSWEMGSQNWSGKFRDEFRRRRGYDLLTYLPALTGRVVGNLARSERFLWDLRQTAQELVVENAGAHLAELAHQHNFQLSLEPYDLNPSADLNLGSVADVPQCEFWSTGFGPNTNFSAIEAVSVGHTGGHPIVAAEAFTSTNDQWRQYPGRMKEQADWALGCGVNKIIFHRFAAQPYLDRAPGMTFGPHGVHWDRTQTWWDMASGFHTYLGRCQELLRQGLPVADILYLAGEGAPHVFRPPASATSSGAYPDRRGYNFDGCDPLNLIAHATVKNGRITFPDGMSYGVLVLPQFATMTPGLLRKIKTLVDAGATVLGAPPVRSPSLENYPQCDQDVRQLAADLWQASAPHHVVADPAYQGADKPPANTLHAARWIWFPEGNPAASAPVGTRYFKREVVVDAGKTIASASAAMTADNTYELAINGHVAGSGDNFHNVDTMDITALLKPGTNLITVTAENTGDTPNPAGLIGSVTIRFRDGTQTEIPTDAQWSAAATKDGTYAAAVDLGAMGMAPWHLAANMPHSDDIYASYDVTARLLAQAGMVPDFEPSNEVRYSHRRTADTDIYFLGNRQNHAITPTCRFRVTGRLPEWWDPISGTCRALPEYQEDGGVTVVPLQMEAGESGFVIFRQPPASGAHRGRNFPPLQAVANIAGPWEVAFDPQWGGPEKAAFAQLEDWTARAEPGIKFYSGKAVYRTQFDVDPQAAQRSLVISLGDVKNMASVRLNGKDLGILWCQPWRVAVPAGALQPHNTLEVTVANLWVNRLIGDSDKPQEKRLTWTTWNPYHKNSPLQPSGLLGPVQIMEDKAP